MAFKKVEFLTNILKNQVVNKAVNDAEARSFYKKQTLSPSVDFMCMTKAYFNFIYSGGNHLTVDKSEFTYEGERAKSVGNTFHEYIQNQFEQSGILRLNETTLTDEKHKIKARLDSVVEINGELYIVELKSAKSYSMHLMNNDGSPDIEHQKQLQLYFHLYNLNRETMPEILEATGGRPITKGIIMYESKNDHTILEFLVNKNDEIINELLKYARILWKHISENREPKYKFEPDSPECKYKCRPQYRALCHGTKIEGPEVKDEGVWGFANAKESSKDPSFRS